jgi:hypothetical protein
VKCDGLTLEIRLPFVAITLKDVSHADYEI